MGVPGSETAYALHMPSKHSAREKSVFFMILNEFQNFCKGTANSPHIKEMIVEKDIRNPLIISNRSGFEVKF